MSVTAGKSASAAASFQSSLTPLARDEALNDVKRRYLSETNGLPDSNFILAKHHVVILTTATLAFNGEN